MFFWTSECSRWFHLHGIGKTPAAGSEFNCPSRLVPWCPLKLNVEDNKTEGTSVSTSRIVFFDCQCWKDWTSHMQDSDTGCQNSFLLNKAKHEFYGHQLHHEKSFKDTRQIHIWCVFSFVAGGNSVFYQGSNTKGGVRNSRRLPWSFLPCRPVFHSETSWRVFRIQHLVVKNLLSWDKEKSLLQEKRVSRIDHRKR